MDRLLDEERVGPTDLRMPAVANVVIASIRKGAPYSVALRRLKRASAREANALLGLSGLPFWQDESYDHLVRSQQQFERIENYFTIRSGLGSPESRKSTPGRAASAG
jgi:putative DNA methylase